MSDLTALKSWREGRFVSRADIDITIVGVAARIAELEAALREIASGKVEYAHVLERIARRALGQKNPPAQERTGGFGPVD